MFHHGFSQDTEELVLLITFAVLTVPGRLRELWLLGARLDFVGILLGGPWGPGHHWYLGSGSRSTDIA